MQIDESIQNGRKCFAAILAYAQQAEATTWNAQELARVIKTNYHYPMDAQLGGLIEQLRVNEGIPWDADAGWHDTRPDLSREEKRKKILRAMANRNPQQQEIQFFIYFQKFVQIDGERLEIEKVCERAFDFIIYRLLHEDGFVMTELHMRSAAWYSSDSRISRDKVIETIRNPRWQGELTWDKFSSLGPADFGLEGLV